MQRKGLEPTFLDGLTVDLGGPRTGSFLEKVDAVVDWAALAERIPDVAPDQPKGGRPFWPLVQMLKCVFLQKAFGLGDAQLEEQLRDRLSFRRFVGLSLEDKTPDETTFVVFRRRLRRAGHARTLFDAVLDQLREKGLVLQEGSLVDATIVDAPRGHTRRDGLSTRDRCASFTHKHQRPYHGYKAHVRTSKDRFITDYVFDTAKVHDSRHIDDLIEREAHAVWADSAYMKKARSAGLKERGVHDGIVHKKVRGQGDLSQAQKEHNRRCSKVRALVEHPFAWMDRMGYGRARYRGLTRNGFDFAMTAAVYNIKRSLSALGMPLTSAPRAE